MEEQEEPAAVAAGDDPCDESKCVSRGKSQDPEDDSFFTCYGDNGNYFPPMCADGYLPQWVEDEPTLQSDLPRTGIEMQWGFVSFLDPGIESTTVQYFTCCPPPPRNRDTNQTIATATANTIHQDAVVRHCSDPQMVPNDDETTQETLEGLCQNHHETRKFARRMKPSQEYLLVSFGTALANPSDYFLCCDSELKLAMDENNNKSNSTSTTMSANNFLQDTECVPYRNNVYQAAKVVPNELGLFPIISCDFPDQDFGIPRPLDGHSLEDFASTGLYQCCRTGSDNALQLFLPDPAFRISISILLAVSLMGALVSAVVAVGLLIPLFLQLGNGSFQRSRSTISRRSAAPSYSTYNLYLVILACFDLMLCLTMATVYGMTICQQYNPRWRPFMIAIQPPTSSEISVEQSVYYSYTFANMLMNAIITHEVLVLLRTSHQARRVRQPSIRRVGLQAGAVCGITLIYGLLTHFNYVACRNAYNRGDLKTYWVLLILGYVVLNLMSLVPVAYVTWAALLIWRKGYIPPTSDRASIRDRAMRGLALYFFRIVMVFYGVWVPFFAFMLAGFLGIPWGFVVSFPMIALQPILTTLVILTKPDVKQYIWDLITLNYITKKCKKTKQARLTLEETSPTRLFPNTSQGVTVPERSSHSTSIPVRSSQNVSILGFTFADFDATDDIDNDDDAEVDSNGENDDGDNGLVDAHIHVDAEAIVDGNTNE